MDGINDGVGKGEYRDLQTGRICCKKCGAPRQTVTILLGHKYTPRVLCKCEAHSAAEMAKDITAKDQMANARNFASARLQSQLLKMSRRVEDLGYNPDSLSIIQNYAEDWENRCSCGLGLLFFGPVGSGKTYLAARLGNTLIDKGVTVLMLDCGGIDKRFYSTPLGEQSTLIESVNKFGSSGVIVDENHPQPQCLC